ncbi:MAG: hypothetical protein LIP03_14660 [Bacteroidales bacterium]|nr:hypothetical protein [Bacteroidales bacterium]
MILNINQICKIGDLILKTGILAAVIVGVKKISPQKASIKEEVEITQDPTEEAPAKSQE